MIKYILDFRVSGLTLMPVSQDRYTIPARNRNHILARFRYGDDWRPELVTAVFRRGDSKPYTAPLENGECIIPAQVMDTPDTEFNVCLKAGDLKVSSSVTVYVGPSDYADDNPPEPPEPGAGYVVTMGDKIAYIREVDGKPVYFSEATGGEKPFGDGGGEGNYASIVYKSSYLDFPNIGDDKNLYVDTGGNKAYRWDAPGLRYYALGDDFNNIKTIYGGNANG